VYNKPTIKHVKAINSISRKFYLTQTQLANFYKGLNDGKSENALLAEMLEAPIGVEPLQYLNSFLSPQELTKLKKTLNDIAPKNIHKKDF
jgi:hypothetical protein